MTGSWAPFGRSSDEADVASGTPPPAPATPASALAREPARRLAVITCMDSRVDPLRDLGLARGDAMILRNAGAQASDDVAIAELHRGATRLRSVLPGITVQVLFLDFARGAAVPVER